MFSFLLIIGWRKLSQNNCLLRKAPFFTFLHVYGYFFLFLSLSISAQSSCMVLFSVLGCPHACPSHSRTSSYHHLSSWKSLMQCTTKVAFVFFVFFYSLSTTIRHHKNNYFLQMFFKTPYRQKIKIHFLILISYRISYV